MVRSLGLLLFLLAHCNLFAMQDTIPAGVYRYSTTAAKPGSYQEKAVISGSSSHLRSLKLKTFTLSKGQEFKPALDADPYESLIIVKEGAVELTIKDSSKVLGPGGMALAIVLEAYRFRNLSQEPATFYILELRSKSRLNAQRALNGRGSFMKNWSELAVVPTTKGESRAIFDQPTPMFSRFDAHATTLNPGIASHDPHTHPAEEIILLIRGDVTEQIGQALSTATTGDAIYLASNVLHNVKNTGSVPCAYFAIQWRE